MENKNTTRVCTEAMEGDKRTYDFTTLLLLSLKRRLYDKLRHSCFRLTQRPVKDWTPEKRIFTNAEEWNSEKIGFTSNYSLTEKTNSIAEVFYTGDGRWLSSDWNTIEVATSVSKRQKFPTNERRRRVQVRPVEPLEHQQKSFIRLSDYKVVQNILPWFFPWIITMLTFLLVSRPKIQDDTRRQRKNRRKSSLENTHSPRNSVRGGEGVSIIQTRGNESALALVSKSERNYRNLKGASSYGTISKKKTKSQSPKNKQSLVYVSPQQRLIMTPPLSPRKSTDQLDYASSASLEEEQLVHTSVKQTNVCQSLLTPDTQQQHNKLPMRAVHRSRDSISEALQFPSQDQTGVTDSPKREGLLSMHFSNDLAIDAKCELDEVLNSNTNKLYQHEDYDVGRLRLAKSCSGRWTGDVTSRVKPTKPLERSSKSLPKVTDKSRALQYLQRKKAEERRFLQSNLNYHRLDGFGSKYSPEVSPPDHSLVFPEGHPMWRLNSSSTNEESIDDLSRGSFETDLTRRIDSQASVDSTSSFGFELEGATSLQTSNLIRQNTRELMRNVSGSGDSSIYRWPTISERESTLTDAGSFGMETGRITEGDEEQLEDEERDEKSVSGVIITDTARQYIDQRNSNSPFSADLYQKKPIPKKNKVVNRKRSQEREVTEDSAEKIGVNIDEAKTTMTTNTMMMKPIKKPPPPPPSSKQSIGNSGRKTTKPAPPTGKGPAPPPPPPMSKGKGGKGGNGISRQPEVIAMFQAVSKASKDKSRSKHKRRPSRHDSSESGSTRLASEGSGGDALIKELECRSTYFAHIQDDIKTHGPKIEQIIKEMTNIRFESMSEMNAYVCEVDAFLEDFADETAVLKQFNWPARYYVYREALALWMEIRQRNDKCRNWTQGTRGISAELTKMRKYMELNIKRLDSIQRTLESEVRKYTANGIPWDATIIPMLHEGTMILLQRYMQIVYDEVSRTQTKTSHRETNVQYLEETIRLAFKIHQFAGGFTKSCTALFDKIAEFTRKLSSDL
eukprot:g3345.t1